MQVSIGAVRLDVRASLTSRPYDAMGVCMVQMYGMYLDSTNGGSMCRCTQPSYNSAAIKGVGRPGALYRFPQVSNR